MEKHYNTLKPRDITRILVDFNKPYDNLLTPAQYFKRQEKCRMLLKTSPEPISDATMVRTSLGHFLQLPHMDKACNDWNTDYPPDTPGTWLKFKQFFTKKFFNYQNHQASLNDAVLPTASSATQQLISSTPNSQRSMSPPKQRMSNSPSKLTNYNRALQPPLPLSLTQPPSPVLCQTRPSYHLPLT